MPRLLRISLLVSLLLHLAALYLADRFWYEEREARAFRARLQAPPRLEPRARAPGMPAPTFPRRELERLVPWTQPGPGPKPPPPAGLPAQLEVTPSPGLAPEEPAPSKAGGPELAREVLPGPGERVRPDTVAWEAMELLRIEDLMRADRERAVVILDPDDRRGTRGFVKFTPLYLDGAWSEWLDPDRPVLARGVPVLADLARYLRDYTLVAARVRLGGRQRFLSRELLKDPIHFLFPGHGGGAISSQVRVQLDTGERQLLREYLRRGGFLFVDAGQSSDSRRFLRAMVAILRDVLGAEGRLSEVPSEHPIYHAFYDYDRGFPGEYKRAVVPQSESSWYYPDQAPETSDYPRGLWGLWLGDELVGVISDLNLHRNWSEAATRPREVESEVAEGEGDSQETAPVASASTTTPFLRAASNVVFYALTREGGLATRRARPAW